MNEENIVYGRRPTVELPQKSLGKLFLQSVVATNRNHIAFVNENTGETLTYGQLLDTSCRLAQSLKTYGVSQDQIIAIASDNHVNNFIVVLAAFFAGIPLAFINPKFTEYELQHVLDIVTPRFLFCTNPYSDKFNRLKSKNSYLQEVVLIDTNEISKFLNQYSNKTGYTSTFQAVDVDIINHLAIILFSSGTTGPPKGVMLTHLNVIATLVYSLDCYNLTRDQGDSLLVLPFFHTYGLHSNLVALLQKKKIILLDKFQPEVYLRAIEKYKISLLLTVPPLVQFLLKNESVDKYDLSSVTDINCGAAPLVRSTEEAIKKKFNIKMIRQGFGMTELGCAMTTPEGVEKLGSVGILAPGLMCVIRDIETGKNLGPRQRGEICVKGPTIMKGYYKNEKATKETFTKDGWMRTGDIAYYDEDEYFYVVDRLKEVIKYKGYQVTPTELEQILLSNPKIQDAAVIGIPDENAGELPLAFVVRQPSVTLDEKEVQDYLARFVSKNKYLYGGVRFVNQIPRTSSGKVLRRQLKEMLLPVRSKL